MLKKLRMRLKKPIDPKVSRELIEYAYRLFLDRDPENEAAIRHHQTVKSYKELRDTFLNSDEFYFNHCKHFAYRLFHESLYAPKLSIDIDVEQDKLDQMIACLKNVWTRYGQEEPYWSVLTAEDFTIENISKESKNRERFYESGKIEVQGLESILLRNDIDPDTLTTCLEYGCGVGRVTRWLASRFEHVYAFDISKTHLGVAKKHLIEKGVKNVDFIHIQSLEGIETPRKIDIIYSILVLQHNPPPIIAYVLEKLLNLLNTGGIAVIQIPTYVKDYRFPFEEYMASMHRNNEMEEKIALLRKSINKEITMCLSG